MLMRGHACRAARWGLQRPISTCSTLTLLELPWLQLAGELLSQRHADGCDTKDGGSSFFDQLLSKQMRCALGAVQQMVFCATAHFEWMLLVRVATLLLST